ncbi:A-kinase anchor protein 14 [Myotis daubentonii]|uniref:A-kinase anchor protein 14 n=1 Tax=Myotis daubentonii TaxID=98922 RepID=UPI0028731D60|nr:A-kinase anchor protein 14 [Myotis daubentonii]
MDSRSRAVTPTVVRCLYLEAFLCVLFLFSVKQTWEYEDRWVHYTKLVERRDLIHSFHYIYSVRWSVPTSQIPTAYSSAFAFFTVKFNKNKPPDAPIDISYMFEGQSLVHRPGTTRFRENWVKEMVVAKHNIMKSFPF